VVEDEPLVAIEIAHILKKAGFDVIGPARSVAPALSLIE
jgi:DNA-binding NarL/FixJ family response regulator